MKTSDLFVEGFAEEVQLVPRSTLALVDRDEMEGPEADQAGRRVAPQRGAPREG